MKVFISRISRGIVGLVALVTVTTQYAQTAHASCGPIACDTDTLDLSGRLDLDLRICSGHLHGLHRSLGAC